MCIYVCVYVLYVYVVERNTPRVLFYFDNRHTHTHNRLEDELKEQESYRTDYRLERESRKERGSCYTHASTYSRDHKVS